ncbi:HNH endonuclease [Bradyrhizobium sp. Leo170]|uniref:HNH endonuclease n=1 Tax=Bradyrhizobium sp. Leo170 TaxID=1571199 RepID=UPI00102E9B40|nr:HNH endonuclease [Bradyrhizobium sp. Leo170]TAI63452.1 HNH endonuclease [Bradyrhizobium sp. Leo170]
MAWKPRRVCSCGKIIAATDLCACQIKRKVEADRRRPSATDRGYDSKWRRESKAFLALPQNRFCACGCGRFADMVDHIKPHRGDMKLFWDRSNWAPLASSPCHSSRKQSLERRQ